MVAQQVMAPAVTHMYFLPHESSRILVPVKAEAQTCLKTLLSAAKNMQLTRIFLDKGLSPRILVPTKAEAQTCLKTLLSAAENMQL